MSTTIERTRRGTVVGLPIDRVDGRAKVTGAARYAADAVTDQPLHAVIVQSTIARGRIRSIDERAARAIPGVVEVLTYRNAPRAKALPFDFTAPASEELAPLQSDEVHYDGQHVAAVIAKTFEAAREGAALLRIEYDARPATLTVDTAHEIELPKEWFGDDAQPRRGDPERAYETSEVRLDLRYATPAENHNPMEPSATLAEWRDGELVVHDSTQWVLGTRAAIARSFELDEQHVRVIAPYLGGGFGCKGFFWPHTLVAAMAAKLTKRPVKLVLSREQMFTSCGYRTLTRQRLQVGASRDGRLRSVLHDTLGETSRVGMFVETAGKVTTMLYDVPNLAVTHRVARLDVSTPTAMRAPGESPGTYSLGCALDELAYACGLDPLEVLRRNHTSNDPSSGLPFSSKHVLECYERGAEAFGWSARAREPRAMREDGELVGYGVATAVYPAMRSPAQARVTIGADGSIDVASATHDLGTGMYTILAQIAADELGVDPGDVRVRIGDSSFPLAPVAGGSMSSASVGPAVQDAARRAVGEAIAVATSAGTSPLHGLRADEVEVRDGTVCAKDDPSRAIGFAELVRLGGGTAIEAVGSAAPGDEGETILVLFVRRAVRRGALRRGARAPARRARPRRVRLRPHPQRQDRSLADDRRDHLGDRDGAARGNRARPALRRDRQQQPRRLPRAGERRHPRHRRALRRGAGLPAQPARRARYRRDRDHRRRRGGRERRLPRERRARARLADRPREAAARRDRGVACRSNACERSSSAAAARSAWGSTSSWSRSPANRSRAASRSALADLEPLFVTTPAVADLIADVPGVQVVVTDPTAGPSETLALAHAAVAPDAYLAVLACDLPFLDAARVRAFVARVPDGADLAWPVVGETPGHPVVWSPKARARIPALRADEPPLRVRRDPALRAIPLAERDDAYVTDVDTPETWAAALLRVTSARH